MSAISLYARETAGFEQRLAQTLEQLRAAAAAHPGRIVLATSLGAEDQVLTDLVARHAIGISIATLQTGRLHAETLELLERTEAHYGLGIERFEPVAEAVLHFVREHGDDAMYRSVELRKACCGLRKLEPLARLLAGRTAWVTGLRRQQSQAREGVPASEVDAEGRTKFNPLAEWSQQDVWHYIASREVPYNPLHDRFFPSIGCEPCTRAVAVGEDIRAGRWWWENESGKECGLHVQADGQTTPLPASTPLRGQTPTGAAA
jgi:phosphoadenosine phosphosulfate reductase